MPSTRRRKLLLALATATLTAGVLTRKQPDDKDEPNTYGLPLGSPLLKQIRRWVSRQRRAVLLAAKSWATLPAALPTLAQYTDPMAAAMTPILSAYWSESGRRMRSRVGLDPNQWQVTSPHVRQKIQQAALKFCRATNQTTDLELGKALELLRQELTEGLVSQGDSVRELTRRVKRVFTKASTSRAETIARSEASLAVHSGQLEAAKESGVVVGKELLISAAACPLCAQVATEARRVKLEDPFAVIGDNPDYAVKQVPPLHNRCRCSWIEVLAEEYGGPKDPKFDATVNQPKPGAEYKAPKGKTVPEPDPERLTQKAPTPSAFVLPATGDKLLDEARQKIAEAFGDEARAQHAVGSPATFGADRTKIPYLLPPGPVAGRIAAYKTGDVKLDYIRQLGERHAAETKALDERHKDAISELTAIRIDYANRDPRDRKETQRLRAKIAELAQRKDQIELEQAGLANRRTSDLAKLLEVPSSAKVQLVEQPTLNIYGVRLDPLSPETKENAKQALAVLTKVIKPGDTALVSTRVGQIPASDRRQRSHHGGSAPYEYIQLRAGEKTSIAAHEVMHAFDAQMKLGGVSADVRSNEFRRYRTAGEQPVYLKTLFPRSGYDAWEKGAKNHFDRAFSAKHAYYIGKEYPGGGSEILAMGVQKLFEDSAGFAAKDPEYCKFVLGMLDGSLR